jgi:Tfp pilus assembly protein PilP
MVILAIRTDIIQISSPDVSKQGSVILLEQADEDEAIRVAQKLAQETGRRVIVRDAKLSLIETIPAASVH